jgi:hypothetical protein
LTKARLSLKSITLGFVILRRGNINSIPDSLSRYPVGAPDHLNLEGEGCGELDGSAVERGPMWGPRLGAGVRSVTQGRIRQEEEAEVLGQPLQSLASGGVTARLGTKSVVKQLLVEGQGSLERARLRGGPAAGWMALVCGRMEVLSQEEEQESDRMEDEVLGWYQWSFESDERGCWLGLEPRVLTWKRVKEAAVKDPRYQMVVRALPEVPEMWPVEVAEVARYRAMMTTVDEVLMFRDRVVIP